VSRRLVGTLVALPLLLGLGLVLWPERPPGPTGAWMSAAGVTPRVETVEGMRVRYVRAGSGPAVVLIHGLASSVVTWRDVLPVLARDHDVVAVDLPGFGASDQPADLSPDCYPAIVTALMDRLGIARASLVGNSLGGAVAVWVAARAPTRVDRLVLLDAAGYNLAPRDRPLLLRLAGSPLGALTDHLPIRRPMVRIGLRQVFYDDSLVTDERVEEYAAPLFRPGAAAAIRSLLNSLGHEGVAFPGVIAQVKAPTLIVWGREDAWIPVRDADRFAATIPGSRTVVLEACGHMPQEERPAEVLRLLSEFLDGRNDNGSQRGTENTEKNELKGSELP
jgi:pimeloyl-ACP methyl ester carboxylesterase